MEDISTFLCESMSKYSGSFIIGSCFLPHLDLQIKESSIVKLFISIKSTIFIVLWVMRNITYSK
jgi:hypothetical protein